MKKLKLAALFFSLMILPAVGQERLGGSVGYDEFMLRQPKRAIDTLGIKYRMAQPKKSAITTFTIKWYGAYRLVWFGAL